MQPRHHLSLLSVYLLLSGRLRCTDDSPIVSLYVSVLSSDHKSHHDANNTFIRYKRRAARVHAGFTFEETPPEVIQHAAQETAISGRKMEDAHYEIP